MHFPSILEHFKAKKKSGYEHQSSRGGGVAELSGLTTKKAFFMCVFP